MMIPSICLNAFLLVFMRMVFGLTFGISAFSKSANLPSFMNAIRNFRLVPGWSVRGSAYLFIAGETAVVILVIIGGNFLLPAFLLAGFLLLVFSGAIALVLLRKMQVVCNCFGPSETPVSAYDLLRNAILGIWSVVGSCILWSSKGGPSEIGFPYIVLAGLWALVYVAIALNIREIFPPVILSPHLPTSPESEK